tara:strand:- start:79 stop:366 length:288 start_codon:yes stop_codon:yes gene_type:complete
MKAPLKIIIVAPIQTLLDGKSPQIRNPNNVDQIRNEYSNGATTLTGARVKALVIHVCPIIAVSAISIIIENCCKFIGFHTNGKARLPIIIVAKLK